MTIWRPICPTLAVHASTQMTISSPEGAAFAASLGATRVVVPRELSVAEIDIGKAAKSLAIDRAGEAGLKKVLTGPSSGFEAGLEQIGKKLDPKQKGKDMLAKLKSDGVL